MAKTPAQRSSQQQAAANFDALFGARQGERLVSGGFKMLAHNRITVRPQVRRTFAPAEMNELRNSIRELRAQSGGIEGSGVLQALLVAPAENGYRLIAGEKRFRATQSEGLSEIPCIVVPAVSEGMTRLLQLTENAVRSAPPVLEEAHALHETLAEQKLSQRDLARLLGKTLGYVTNRLSLLKMGTDVQEMIAQRSDTLKHAPLIETVSDGKQRTELIRAVVEEAISVRELERRLRSEPEISVSLSATPEAKARTEVFSRENTSKPKDKSQPEPSRQGAIVADLPADTNSQAKNPVNDGHNLVLSFLEPARALIAEANRSLQELTLTSEDKAKLHSHIDKVERDLKRIKKSVQ